MSHKIEFGNKQTADQYREEHQDYLCSDDDKRTKTVTFIEDTPERILRDAEAKASEEDARARASEPPQDLEYDERKQLDFSLDGLNVPKARHFKGAAKAVGGHTGWISAANEHPTFSREEFRALLERRSDQRQESGSNVYEKGTGEAREEAEKAASIRQMRARESEQCEHARGFCQNGDPDACEFLQEECGLSEDEVATIMEGLKNGETSLKSGSPDDSELSGQQAGAISRSMGGYSAAIAQLESLLEEVEEQWEYAQASARAVNSIRESVGYESQHFHRLEDVQADLADLLRTVQEDCTECHADHSEHEHPEREDDREDLRESLGSETEVDASHVGSPGEPTDA